MARLAPRDDEDWDGAAVAKLRAPGLGGGGLLFGEGGERFGGGDIFLHQTAGQRRWHGRQKSKVK